MCVCVCVCVSVGPSGSLCAPKKVTERLPSYKNVTTVSV